MQLFFNSTNSRFKTPFGAFKAGEAMTLRVEVPHGVFVEKIYVELRKQDEETIYYPMKYCGKAEGTHSYTFSIQITSEGIYWYRFFARSERGTRTFGRGKGGNASSTSAEFFQQTVTSIDYNTPAHLKGGLIYHIFVDRFAIGGRRVSRQNAILKEWDEEVTIIDSDGVFRANDFYGGNLQGIIDKLDYLASLNVTLLYLSPIFKSASNHRYDTGDYMTIDEMLGDEFTFKSLIDNAAKRGIGIMLDGVFNHTGADSLYFNKFNHYDSIGAYQGIRSPYFEWYHFIHFPNDYACWWGITVTPTVNKLVESYRRFIMGSGGVLDKWTSFGLKGWRLDVVDELDKDFVNGIRTTLKAKDSEIAVIGEVWEDASTKVAYGSMRPYLLGNQLDGVMNYPFKEAIINVMLSRDTDAFVDSVMTIVENYPKQSLDCCMTLLGTHDTARILSVLSNIDMSGTTKEYRRRWRMSAQQRSKAVKLLKVASALQYFLPGVPSVYYGDEIGMQGYEDPLNRRAMTWNDIDTDLLNHYRKLGGLRADNRSVFAGEFNIRLDNGLVAIERRDIVTNAGIKLLVNLSDTAIRYNLPDKIRVIVEPMGLEIIQGNRVVYDLSE